MITSISTKSSHSSMMPSLLARITPPVKWMISVPSGCFAKEDPQESTSSFALSWVIATEEETNPSLTVSKEDGVFDALKKKVLKSVQISLFADANDQGTILEAYTFSVTYSESPDTDAQISGIQFHSQGASTTRSEQTNLTSFVHQVEMQIEKLDLNRLPSKRSQLANMTEG